MGLVKKVFFLFALVLLIECSEGVVYQVGDSAGWTLIGNVDYNKWASSKTFQVGDTLFFEYDPRYHNVMQVSRSSFHSCDTTSAPIATYATGNDSITIKSHGHYYFICGFVGHCQAGQKVDCRVPKSHVGPVASPVQPPHVLAVPEASPVGPLAPGPSPNSGESLFRCSGLFCGYGGLLITVAAWVGFCGGVDFLFGVCGLGPMFRLV